MRRAIPLGLWLGLGAALAALTSRVADWFVMTDELLYERLALSVGRLHSPLPHVHRELIGTIDQVYPLLIAPFFAGGSIGHDLHVAHIVNAFAMTFAVVPAYLLALRVTGVRWAAIVAGLLTGVVPWMTLASLLLTNVAAYPLFAWALLAIHSAVTAPSKRNDALAALAVALAVGARTQLAALGLVLAVAVLVHSRPRRHPMLLAVFGAAALLAIGVAAAGHSPLGAYETTTKSNPIPPTFFPALFSHSATLALGLGLIPFLIGGAWLTGRVGRDPFATIGATAAVALIAEVASYDVRFGGGLARDRYLCYLAPVFAVAFAAGLARRVSRVWLLVPASVLVVGFAVAPLPTFIKFNADTPASVVDNYLRRELGGLTGARLFLCAAVLVATVLIVEAEVLLRRGVFVAVVAVLAIGVTTADTAYAFDRLFSEYDTGGRPLTQDQSVTLGWVDGAVGRDAEVTQVPFPTLHGQYWAGVAYWWDLEFWNASVDRSVGIPGEFEWTPSTFPKLAISFERAGRSSVSPPGYVIQAVGDTRFHLMGTVVLNNRDVFLVRPAEPWRADWSTSGLYDDGWTRPGVVGRIHVYPYQGQTQRVTRSLQVSVSAPSGVASRRFTLGSNAGRVTGDAGGNLATTGITVCVPPRRPADVRLSVDGASSVYGDATSERTAPYPRLAGVLVTRIYLSGSIGAAC